MLGDTWGGYLGMLMGLAEKGVYSAYIPMVFAGAIVKSGVQATESSGGLIDCCYLDSIFEFDSSDYFGQVIESA